MTFFEIEVRDDQQAEKKQRVDDEQVAEPCISPREVSDAGRWANPDGRIHSDKRMAYLGSDGMRIDRYE